MDSSSEIDFFKALAHPARVQILDILRGEPACVCHLTAILGKPQPYVSQQVAVLRDAGLLIDEKIGLNVFYRVRDPRVYDLIDQARTISDGRSSADCGRQVDTWAGPIRLADCPCPKCQAAAASH